MDDSLPEYILTRVPRVYTHNIGARAGPLVHKSGRAKALPALPLAPALDRQTNGRTDGRNDRP